jgi:CheY-like chemotaxis protein/tetratricopeptide (TPR) repeat protein
MAKNLISESISIFEAVREQEKVAEAQVELAICYWRQGALDEARVLLQEALSRLADSDGEVKAVALIRWAIVERWARRFNDALQIYVDAAPLFERIDNHALKGRFHVGYAVILRNLSEMEGREDYIDRALIEYTAARYHFEQAGHQRYCARVENNLGFLFSTIGKFSESHEHLDRAERMFVSLQDSGSVAQVKDTRAKVLLAEGRVREADRAARAAVEALEKGGEQALLVEALTTQGIAQARLGECDAARATFRRAVEVAEQAGDREGAGQAALAFVEELGAHAADEELCALYERAAGLLSLTQHPGLTARLLACSRMLIGRLSAVRAAETGRRSADVLRKPPSWDGFSIRREMRRYERFLIERALEDAGGVVTQAARLLGFKHHFSLISLINNFHQSLIEVRSPVVPRKRSIITRQQSTSRRAAEKTEAPSVTILHVEDNKFVSDVVKGVLEPEGWRVEVCPDGNAALRRIAGNTHFDLLLFDYDLPGLNGVELTRVARKLSHRRRTPVVMLSATECETEAWRAGVDAFLRKPDDVTAVTETVVRLLSVGG